MIRFQMPDREMDFMARAAFIEEQLKEFLGSEPLREIFSLLDADLETIGIKYNGRKKGGGMVETQELYPSEALEGKRERLYPLFRELGFFDINAPIHSENSHVIVLGGALTACLDRTECADKWIGKGTRFMDGLACYRPINPVERKRPGFDAETEFGAMTKSFLDVFKLREAHCFDDFTGDRNLNSISCIREYHRDGETLKYRIFAAPSSEPEARRADTGDTLRFYLRNNSIGKDDTLLFITNNRYCNRQFLQLSYCMLMEKCSPGIDIIGCSDDDRVMTAEKYDPFQYLQDLIAIIDQAGRFSALYKNEFSGGR